MGIVNKAWGLLSGLSYKLFEHGDGSNSNTTIIVDLAGAAVDLSGVAPVSMAQLAAALGQQLQANSPSFTTAAGDMPLTAFKGDPTPVTDGAPARLRGDFFGQLQTVPGRHSGAFQYAAPASGLTSTSQTIVSGTTGERKFLQQFSIKNTGVTATEYAIVDSSAAVLHRGYLAAAMAVAETVVLNGSARGGVGASLSLTNVSASTIYFNATGWSN